MGSFFAKSDIGKYMDDLRADGWRYDYGWSQIEQVQVCYNEMIGHPKQQVFRALYDDGHAYAVIVVVDRIYGHSHWYSRDDIPWNELADAVPAAESKEFTAELHIRTKPNALLAQRLRKQFTPGYAAALETLDAALAPEETAAEGSAEAANT